MRRIAFMVAGYLILVALIAPFFLSPELSQVERGDFPLMCGVGFVILILLKPEWFRK